MTIFRNRDDLEHIQKRGPRLLMDPESMLCKDWLSALEAFT